MDGSIFLSHVQQLIKQCGVYFFYRILFVIQKYLENVPIEHGSKVSQNEENLAIHAQDWNVTNFQGVQVVSQAHLKNGTKKSSFIVSENNTSDGQPITSQVSLTLPKTLFDTMESKSAEQRVSFVVFRKISLFQHADQSSPNANAQTQIRAMEIGLEKIVITKEQSMDWLIVTATI